MARLWDKGQPLNERILKFTVGEDHKLDERLLKYDVLASIAHTQMLEEQGLLTSLDSKAICGGLKKLHKQHSQGQWSISLEEEDVHGALEARLIELIGPAGGRMHLGRSRNDQVLVALRLYLKDATNTLQLGAEAVSDSLEALAKRQGDIPLPGYTHMQPAMPSSVGLWAKGFSAEIRDDARGLNVAKSRADFNPLGSAAGYGTPGININRESTTKQLGFSSAHEPVTAVQLSRGKAEATLTFEIALLLGDLSRLASDLLLFYTSEFAFISLPHEMTTGSSIMPQKRNPDVLELIRSTQAVATGALTEILSITTKLNSGYQRDLQRVKAPLFRVIDLANDALGIMEYTLEGITFKPENIHLDSELNAAEQANRLAIEEGIPFREAYQKIASLLDKID